MDNRFEILEELAGQGGYGKVDKARDNELEREVAIKTLDPLFRQIETNDVERFKREAKTLAALNHPNIPAIYDVTFKPESNHFKIIYAWINGNTVAKYLKDIGIFSLDLAKIYFKNICSALKYAHDKGIIHRDIKPSNLIIAQDEESCYLVDFGISLTVTDVYRLTDGTRAVGSPGYMSPEQEANEELTPASDIFSLGIVLYEVLSGNRPTIGEYRPLNSFNEAIPPSIDNLIRDSLKDKSERIQTADEFYNRLNKALKPNQDIGNSFAQGAIHDIIASLKTLNHLTYSSLPKGQQILVHTRLKTLVQKNEFNLRNPIAALLHSLLVVSGRMNEKDFNQLIEYSLRYGFDEQYGERYFGNPAIREELSKMSIDCEQKHHKIISNQILSFLSEKDISEKESWYLFMLRDILQNLLANSICEEEVADKLAFKLEEILGLCY